MLRRVQMARGVGRAGVARKAKMPRPARSANAIAVFNWARAGRQKIVYAINDALGDASGEALAIMLRAAGGDDLSLDDFFGGEARNPLRGQSPP